MTKVDSALLVALTAAALVLSLDCQTTSPPPPGPDGGAKPIQGQEASITVATRGATGSAGGMTGAGGFGAGGAGGAGGN